MSQAEIHDRIWSTPMDQLTPHELEIKLGLYQADLMRLRQAARQLEHQACLMRAEEAATLDAIRRARHKLGLRDAPIPDRSREEPAHD